MTPAERREFLRLVPEFVIEVMSPSDRLKKAKQKMETWIASGVPSERIHREVFGPDLLDDIL